ncbi:hypothetical protein N5J77_27780 [Sphingobium yanoikuyae]|uniref:Phage tail protein n=1 Tax=Sphingobium yanoikuyae TaxID=13690 RepID=A0AA43BFK9_SPHYA|nr:hypothetical protein [Sphingobium yanoikuyae]MDH2134937.1 hypothetical protein [Sphingobium yanoikuyae]MDH2152790.1 hypothetical protein [Sphingobium yanoikuyae]MDH2170256.1 hypothetical protein [Sphingobium yanoikuyae]
MSKVVKIAAMVVVAAALIVFAAPIAGALGITAITAGTVAAAGVGLAISAAMAIATTLFVKPPSLSQSMAERLNSSINPTAPRKIIFGRTAAGNDIRFFEEHDLPSTKKDGYSQIVALASHRIHALRSWYVEEQLTWAGSITGKYRAGVRSFRAVLEGTSTNGSAIGSGQYWTSTATFTGCAYAAITFKLDGDVWESGLPSKTTFVVDGCPLYDPRRDSSNGGTGAHRIANQATWSFYDGSVEIGRNPALALATYLTGYRINGKLVWGMGVPPDRIDWDNFRDYANLCEERVALQDGTTVQRYTADGSFSTADSHETIILALTAAMGSCKLTDVGGRYTIIGGFDDTLGPTVDFTADHLVAAPGSPAPYSWIPVPPARETYNIARGRFSDPNNQYQLSDWGAIETDPLNDGVPRTMTIDLGLVSRAETCQRIAKQFLLREAKTPGVFSATFGPLAFAATVGSLVTLSLPQEGWNRKLFRVLEQTENHDLLFQMVLREESSEIYAWDREEKPLPASIRPPGYDPSTTISPEGVAVTSQTIKGADGYPVSEITVTWTPENSGRVRGVQIESKPSTTSSWTEQAAGHTASAGTFTFTSNVPAAVINVRLRYRMDSGVYSAWVVNDVDASSAFIDWDSNVIVGENKPDDRATEGAPEGTYVGSQPAENVVDAITGTDGQIIRTRDISVAVNNANAAIDELVETYGSTATAAASANAAQIAASAAQASAGASQNASDNAATAKSAAEQAENDAVAAKTAAEAARSQALTAATNAGTANTNAQAAKTAAQTAKADAEAAFANSTTAKNAAVAAQGAAETARNNAQTYASNASNSATAAAGSATTASTKASEAGNSATAAAASAVSASSSFDAAKVTAASLLPSDFMQDGLFWSHTFTGAPGSQAALSNAVSYVDVANVGRVAQMTGTSTYRYIAPLGAVSVIAGRTYRLTMSVRATSATTPVVRLYGIYLSSSYGQIGQPSGAQTLSVQNQWYNISLDVTGDALIAANGAYLRPLLRLDPGDTHTIQLAFLKIEDVTSQLASAASANAASTSASAAATSATDAGTSASAAQTSATTATTQAGKASTSATNAATSETNAKGAENAAKTSQTAAATSATNAGNSATAAATSASTASTKATEAGQSASTATTQANTAITKAGEASTSATNAATSESNALGSKNAAASSATNAATSATNAGNSASAASGSASTAGTKATEAGNAATSAAASAVSANSTYNSTLGALYVASPILPSSFDEGAKHWTNQRTGNPTSLADIPGTAVIDADMGPSLEFGNWAGAGNNILTKGVIAPKPGRIYEVSVSLKITQSDGAVSFNLALGTMLSGFGTAASNYRSGTIGNYSATGSVNVLTGKFSLDSISGVTTIPADVVLFRAGVRLNSSETSGSLVFRVGEIRITDVTEREAALASANGAAASASAAASSASSAGTSATNAGNSANSATQSANTASTKANEASNSATSAANSASSASSSSTNASNSATAANSSEVSAKLSAASQMPSDFQQDGKFWQQGFGGLPAALNPITANSTFSFVNNSDVGRSMRVTATAQTDVGNIGMMPLQADRVYRLTAKVRQQTGSVFAQLQLYRIGVTSAGGSTGNGTVRSTYTFTALNEWVELAGTVPASTTNAMIAAGASSIRCLLRLLAASSTVTVDYAYIRIEDISESTGAAGSASAAANSASQASASQSAAGLSASSAQTSATNAATSAGQASTSASSASTSANNAAGSANTASTQATNASNSANAASGSATSAGNSASAASTSASSAGNSATTATSGALYAASRAAGNFVAKPTFEDSEKGMWNGTVSVIADANSAAGTTKALRSQARDATEGTDFIPLPATNDRIFRISGYARGGSSSAYAVNVGIQGQLATGAYSYPYSRAANAGVTTWSYFDFNITIPANIVRFKPFVQSQNDSGQAGSVHDARVVGLRIEDVTESSSAAGSANAAANSASAASASQSAAGSSATSATSSANTAATQASNASSSASAAAGSASSAATSSSNAGSSASSATNSANTASTKAGEASSSASAAAGSASSASAAASTATTQANLTALYSTGGGNLLQNTDFAVDLAGWSFAQSGSSHNGYRNLLGDSYRPQNENTICIHQTNSTAAHYAFWQSLSVPVTAGEYYEASVGAANARAHLTLYLRYMNASGAVVQDFTAVKTTFSEGNTLASFPTIFAKGQAPAGATQVVVIVLKSGTLSGNSDSYAWFVRPQLRKTFASAPSPCSYSIGGNGLMTANQQAAISTTQTALATANASIANLNTNVSTLNSSVNVQQTAINNLNGKTAAYWQVNAVAGGRAQLTVYADSNGGGGVDIVGDLRVTGNALITGTVNPEALALGRFVKRLGPVSISPSNSTGTLYSSTLGETLANGSYLLEGTVGFTYTSGRSTTTYNGKPLYTDYANDGGVNVLLKKNGNIIASTGWSGNLLTNYASLAYGSAMTTVFDAPASDTYTGNVTVEVVAFKGNVDSGIVNQGDYYTRTISGNYSNFSFSNLRLKWTFI